MMTRDQEEWKLERTLCTHEDSLWAALVAIKYSEGKDREAIQIAIRESVFCDHIRHALSFLRASRLVALHKTSP